MNIQENAVVHNKFEFLVINAQTGEEMQRAVAYNTVLDNWFHSKTDWSYFGYHTDCPSRTEDLLSHITFGTGTGVITPNRTTLFSFLGRKVATTIQTVYAYPTSYVQKQIKLEANEFVGQTIKEVGFEYSYYNGWYPYNKGNYLMTLALLQDSEGNEIAISKTDVDVVYITATFYCTHTPSGFGTNAIYPEVSKNYLVKWVLYGNFDSSIRFSRFPLPYSSDMNTYTNNGKNMFTGEKGISMSSAVGNFAAGRLDMPMVTFLDGECNNRIIKHIGSSGIGAVTLPDHDIFPPYLVERIPIGTGDGVTTEFNIKAPLIMPASETIYVDNVSKVREVDYTIDYESNCGDWYENYHTAGLSCRSAGVTFGNIASIAPSAAADYRDPLAWWTCYDRTFYPTSCLVNDANPIKLDFGTAKPCNTMKIDILTVPAGQIANLKIQYSSNSTDWTDVPNLTRTNQLWKWTETSARYWKVFIPSYSWTYTLTYQTTARDGQSYGSSFFLGKTVPGLKFTTPPPAGVSIDATYSLEYPFKTANNLLRFTYSIVLQRG